MLQLRRIVGYLSLGLGITLGIAYWLRQEVERQRQQTSPSASSNASQMATTTETHIVLPVEALDQAEVSTDNLAAIHGIGPKTAEALTAIGINTFSALATASSTELYERLKNVRGVSEEKLQDWIRQAKDMQA
jgi:predicted flap endonuclease-1-like 5' DNA nuclease